MVLAPAIPSLDHVGDPSDWPAGCEAIKALDSSLRCDLCFVSPLLSSPNRRTLLRTDPPTPTPLPGAQDIFWAPVSLKTCAHTFCSTCIRTHINQPGSAGAFCPKCRQNKAYDSELIPVTALETTAESWRKMRPFVMQLWKRAEDAAREADRLRLLQRQEGPSGSGNGGGGSLNANGKRAADDEDNDDTGTVVGDDDDDDEEEENDDGAGRRRSRRVSALQQQSLNAAQGASGSVGASAESAYVLSDDDDAAGDASYTDPSDAAPSNGRAAHSAATGTDKSDHALKSDDRVTCPICEHYFTVAALNTHLDRNKCYPGCPPPTAHERGIAPRPKPQTVPNSAAWFSRPGSSHLNSNTSGDASSSSASRRLHRPQYSLKSERDLRKLLETLGLPTQGDKEKLAERHRQYVNLYNANLDAAPANRKSEARLKRELNEWERARDARGGALTDRRSQSWLVS